MGQGTKKSKNRSKSPKKDKKKKTAKSAKTGDPVKPSKSEPAFEMTGAQLRATEIAVAREKGRYALDCVQVDDRGVVGTDGRRLHFVPHDKGQKAPDRPYLVQGGFLKKLKALFKPSNLKKRTIRMRGRSVPVENPDAERREQVRAEYLKFYVENAEIDRLAKIDKLSARLDFVRSGERLRVVEDGYAMGRYPDFWAVAVQETEGMVHVAVDPDFVIGAMKALKESTTVEKQAVLLSVKDKNSGFVLTAHNGASALVMPVDFGDNDFPNRPFLKEAAPKSEADREAERLSGLVEELEWLKASTTKRSKIRKAVEDLIPRVRKKARAKKK